MIKKYVNCVIWAETPFWSMGYCLYPVVYKGKEYIVTIKPILADAENFRSSYKIHRYSPKWALFVGHKRKFIDSNFLEPIVLKDGLEADVLHLTETEFDLNIKEIMAGVFDQSAKNIADKAVQEEQSQAAADNLHQWDGRLD